MSYFTGDITRKLRVPEKTTDFPMYSSFKLQEKKTI